MDSQYYDIGGTIRALQPNKTRENLASILNKIGITRIANITGLDNLGIPVVTCIRPNAKHLSVSQGKGITKTLAEISAIMESIECYHMENPEDPVMHGSYIDLKSSYRLVDIHTLTQLSHCCVHHGLASYPLEWAACVELNSGVSHYIPYVLTCLDSTRPHPAYNFFRASTNGIAAGNTRDEALCHSLCEIIERDALYKWKKSPIDDRQMTRLINHSIDDDVINQLLFNIHESDLEVKIWDVTSNLKIPTFHCTIDNKNVFRGQRFFSGTGTHLSKSIALLRAITEAIQARLTLISGNRDDVFHDYYFRQSMGNMSHNNTEDVSVKLYQHCINLKLNQSFEQDINQLSKNIYDAGYPSIFIIDHTQKELAIPVVQTVIPGMLFDGSRM